MKYGVLWLVFVCMVCCVGIVQAEEPYFPETEEEIFELLSKTPLRSKGVQVPKGPGGIFDYRTFVVNLGTHTPSPVKIFFDTNSTRIKSESRDMLRKYAHVLQRLPDIIFVIAGHADTRGSDAHNLKLSTGRAQSVANYLIEEYDIAAKRLIVSGLGEMYPIASNDTPEGQEANRRVEFIRLE